MATRTMDAAEVGAQIAAKVEGITLGTALARTVNARPDSVALRWRNGDSWPVLTWREYAEQAARVAAGLRELGLERGQRLVMVTTNRPEFHLVDLAALLLGATPISIYTSSAPEQIRYIAAHSEATLAIVESPEFLERLLRIRSDLGQLRHLVIIEDPDRVAPADVVSFDRLIERPALDWEAAAEAMEPDDLATVIYTSGTTGRPKGVMVSNRNVLWTIESLLEAFGHTLEGRRVISFLPMAHIAERMTSHYVHIHQGTEVTTCPDPALLADYLREVRPQLLTSVPRVLEKAHSTVVAMAAASPEGEESLNHAVEVGLAAALARAEGHDLDPDRRAEWETAESQVLSGIRLLMGLDQCEVLVTTAAPIPVGILDFFLGLGLPISELYGLSECCGPATWDPWEVRPGTCGRPIPGCELRLAGDGEILLRGGNVFAGYLKDPERTAEVLDSEGWLHTGDIGRLDRDGYLRIIDRKKELIVTASGKNISPSNLEAALRTQPLVGQACVVGDRRPYLVALLTLDPDMAWSWAAGRGIEASTLAELTHHPAVVAAVSRSVDEVNQRVSRAEQVKRFRILEHEWPPDSDELTPTMKLRRTKVLATYAADIEDLYSASRWEPGH